MDYPSAIAMYVMPCLGVSDVARLRGASSSGILAFDESIALGTAAAAASVDPSATPSTWHRWFPLAPRGLRDAAGGLPGRGSVTPQTVCLGWNCVDNASAFVRGLGRVSVVNVRPCRGLWVGTHNALPYSFLRASNVVIVNLAGLDWLMTLGDNCLSETPSLRSLVLPSSISTIGNFFCSNSGIEDVDMGNLPQLHAVGYGFLSQSNAVSVTLAGCGRLTALGNNFLSQTASLRSLVLPPSISTIGSFFCCKSGIEDVDLGNLPQLDAVDYGFLSRSNAVSVTLGGCGRLTALGNNFLSETASLRSLVLPPSISTIGTFFCSKSGIEDVDLGNQPQLDAVDCGFLLQSNAVSVTLAGCGRLTALGDNFLSETASLRSLALPPSISTIGDFFCSKSGIDPGVKIAALRAAGVS